MESLSREIQARYTEKLANDEVNQKWENIVQSLTSILEAKYPGIQIVLSGSCGSGLGSENSDLDLICSQPKFFPVTVQGIGHVLRSSSEYTNVEVISRAKVPIVSFQARTWSKSCDISIMNTSGLHNCYLLKAYGEADSRVHPLLMFIVQWGKDQDIIGAKYHKLASFVLKMMVINYLQVGCTPSVVPSLQREFPQHFANCDFAGITAKMKAPIPQIVREYQSRNTENLGSLLVGFFRYYSRFPWSSKRISVRDGNVKYWPPYSDRGKGDICLFVECPYTMQNTARSVFKDFIFRRIKMEFTRAEVSYS